MSIRPEVLPFLAVSVVVGAVLTAACRAAGAGWAPAVWAGAIPGTVLALYMLYFFRDPERTPPADPRSIVAGADGIIAAVTLLGPDEFRAIAPFCGLDAEQAGKFLRPNVVRVSIFLSLFDVHVNRSPIAGKSRFLGYFPGRHLFTFKEKSSDVNQHNAILIENDRTRCLVTQIVGPVARRVVYWPDHDRAVDLGIGARIGMMKFGSRLDMYFPERDVRILVEKGARVAAGETVIATLAGEDGK